MYHRLEVEGSTDCGAPVVTYSALKDHILVLPVFQRLEYLSSFVVVGELVQYNNHAGLLLGASYAERGYDTSGGVHHLLLLG